MKKTFKYAIGSLCTVFAMTAYACSDSNTTISSGEVSSEVSGECTYVSHNQQSGIRLDKKSYKFQYKG